MAQLAVAATMFVASAYKGRQVQKTKEREAEAYLDAADRRQAAMTREISEEQRKQEHMESRFRAVAAMQGGGGLGTSGITRLLGDLNAEGEYNILATMWQGMNDVEGLNFRAEAAEREGDAAFTSGIVSGIASAVSSYAGMGGFDPKTPVPTATPTGAMSPVASPPKSILERYKGTGP